MDAHEHRFIVDAEGRKKAVVLDIDDYQTLLDELEELEAIRAYDAAMTCRDDVMPFEQATMEIERTREE